MWAKTTKQITFNGTVAVSVGSSSPPLPLRGVLVDVYRVEPAADGTFQFHQINQLGAFSGDTGDFSFTNLPVTVESQMITLAEPPYTPLEFVNPASFPTLAFRVYVDAELLMGTTTPATQYIEVYDERPDVDSQWLAGHPERVRVRLTGSPIIEMIIPEGDPEAMAVAGIVRPAVAAPADGFYFLRVGRALREEIGDIGDTHPDFAGRAGYMRSGDMQTPAIQSFFPGVEDAPFGGTLHIGGAFGTKLLKLEDKDELYYTVSYWKYTGDPELAFDPTKLTNEKRIEDALFNKKYLIPPPGTPGQWQTLHLGPFDGTVLEPGSPPASIKVYKRPPKAQADEYWPFRDLVVLWNTGAAPDGFVVLTLEAYEKTGGTLDAPELKKKNVSILADGNLPLMIDNRRPVLQLFDWRTGVARFTPKDVVTIQPFDDCSEIAVQSPEPVPDRNECILVRYSIVDENGKPHPHVLRYDLGVWFTPRGTTTNEISLPLRDFTSPGSTYAPISESYSKTAAGAPEFTVTNRESVLVPAADDGWPPENGGDAAPQCRQYALAVSASCSVRTVDGWAHMFGDPRLSRHIIVRHA